MSDSQSFLKEMQKELEINYCEFRGYQKLVWDTLKEFHAVCMKNNIKYYLAAGSLLGVVRDGGQIPWDYDIDVWVKLKDAKALMKALDQDLPDGYHYITRFKDKNYRAYTIKIAPKGYDCEVLHVDVFWLAGASDQAENQQKERSRGKWLSNTMLHKYTHRKYFGAIQGRYANLMHEVLCFKSRLVPDSYLDRLFFKLMGRSCDACEDWIDNDFQLGGLYKKQWFGDPVLYNVSEDMQVCVPQDYKSLLTSLYGNYMEAPNIESRMKEWTNALQRLNSLAKLPD